MIPLLIAIAAGLWGAMVARKQGGNRMDMAQYAAGYAIAGVLFGLLIGVVVARVT